MHAFLLNISLEVELLGRKVCICSALGDPGIFYKFLGGSDAQ